MMDAPFERPDEWDLVWPVALLSALRTLSSFAVVRDTQRGSYKILTETARVGRVKKITGETHESSCKQRGSGVLKK